MADLRPTETQRAEWLSQFDHGFGDCWDDAIDAIFAAGVEAAQAGMTEKGEAE